MKKYRNIFDTAGFAEQLEVRDKYGRTFLHQTCRNGNITQVIMLIIRGMDIEARDNNGWTPLHDACLFEKHNVSEFLVAHGADPFALNNAGQCALDLDNSMIKDELGNEIPHKEILIQLRTEYLNKHAVKASECTAALSSGWEMEI